MGPYFYLSKLQSCSYRRIGNHGHQLIYLRAQKIFRHPWDTYPTTMRPRYQLRRRKSELDSVLNAMDQRTSKKYVTEQKCDWIFNPPHASHFGGAWERQIGTARRILDAMFLELGSP